MKVQAIAAVWLVCLSSTILMADYPEITICMASDVQKNHDIQGDIVAWEDYRHGSVNPEIFWLDITDPNLIQHRIELAGKQLFPAVSGNTIAWQDDRLSANRDIYTYDLLSGAVANLPDAVHQRKPDAAGQLIACESLLNGSYNIALWNAAQSRYDYIAPYAASQLLPAVDGTFLIWEDYRGSAPQIYGCQLSDAVLTAGPLAPSSMSQVNPSVSGRLAAWGEKTGSGATTVTLTVYDLTADAVIWTHVITAVDTGVCVSDGIVVWHQYDPAEKAYDIMGYNVDSKVFYEISTGIHNDRFPVISGRTVVWQRNETDLYAAVISSPAVLAVTAPAGGQTFLAGADIEIAWAMVEGQVPATVDLDFSSDGVSWVEIEAGVPFDQPYLWQAAAVTSNNCRVRVRSSEAEASSDVFTVFQCSPLLTGDLTGDCFVGIEDFAELAAQWLACGNPYDQMCLN